MKEKYPAALIAMHWIHLLSMGLLLLSGLYIHYVFWAGWMGTMRQIHFITMYVLVFVVVVRGYWALVGGRDIGNFFPQKENRGTFLEILKYYLFLRRTHPKTAKFNPLQKITYDFWALLLVLEAISGFALYWPGVSFFATLNLWVGGLGVMRMIHFLIMWLFIVTVGAHIYLGLVEESNDFAYFLWGVKRQE